MNVSAGVFINDLVMQPTISIMTKFTKNKLFYYTVGFNNRKREVLLTKRFNTSEVNGKNLIEDTINFYKETVKRLPEDLLEYIPNKFYVFEEFNSNNKFDIGLNILIADYLDIDEVDRSSAIYKLKVWQH